MPAYIGHVTISPDGRVFETFQHIGLPVKYASQVHQLVKKAAEDDLPQQEVENAAAEIHPNAPGLFKVWQWKEENQLKLLLAGLSLLAANTIISNSGDISVKIEIDNSRHVIVNQGASDAEQTISSPQYSMQEPHSFSESARSERLKPETPRPEQPQQPDQKPRQGPGQKGTKKN